MVAQFFRKQWFMVGLALLPFLVLADFSLITVNAGIWLKNNHGPDIVIVLIFFLSGLSLNTEQVKDGLRDVKGTLLALLLIFLIAPIIASLIAFLPLNKGIIIGILIVSVMPTTLSSGVVMTGSSGGNMAHSLLITIIANSLAVATIPLSLDLLLGSSLTTIEISIDQAAIMKKLATLVLLPLASGTLIRRNLEGAIRPILPYTTKGNQVGILTMVWMAVCAGRTAIVSEMGSIILVILTVFFFHLFLVLCCLLITRLFSIPKTRRESIIFMGGQKTLPLSVILQVSLFPQYGIALVVCVMHHIIHLIMDSYLITYLKKRED